MTTSACVSHRKKSIHANFHPWQQRQGSQKKSTHKPWMKPGISFQYAVSNLRFTAKADSVHTGVFYNITTDVLKTSTRCFVPSSYFGMSFTCHFLRRHRYSCEVSVTLPFCSCLFAETHTSFISYTINFYFLSLLTRLLFFSRLTQNSTTHWEGSPPTRHTDLESWGIFRLLHTQRLHYCFVVLVEGKKG